MIRTSILSSVLSRRLFFLAAILVLELLTASIWLDTGALGAAGFSGWVGDWGPPALRALVAAGAIFVTLGYLRGRSAFDEISGVVAATPVRWTFLAGHAALIAAFGFLSSFLFGARLSGPLSDRLMIVWLLDGLAAVALAALAFFPLRVWLRLIRGAGWLWAYAAVAGSLAWVADGLNRSLWKISTTLTFAAVKAMLRPFLAQLIANPAAKSIGSPSFHVEISPQCSGVEGAALMLVFGVLWLWYFRKESRFPQALLLIPAGVTVLWLLNAVRIAALILIGNAGAPSVALGGFHSQAGWMAFNVVALGFSVGVQRLPWITTRESSRPAPAAAANPATPYLMPFLAILAAAMISRALAGGLEWLYPLRFFAAAAALWCFRRKYVELDWSFGWTGPAAGVAVFAMWMWLDRIAGAHAASPIASGIASLGAPARVAWLALRTLAAVATVPVAEELAFRGFLIRRIQCADFESLSPRSFTFVSLAVSSVVFGLLHGDRWLAGTVAGLIYAGAYLRRGRIGDAVVAHAVTNALLAGVVLTAGRWDLW